MKDKDLKGENISTVGVDIGNLVLQRGNREIIFRTWDFGGQVWAVLLFVVFDHVSSPSMEKAGWSDFEVNI